MTPSRTLPIYLGAGSLFAALAARGFLLPLRASELGIGRFQIGLIFAASVITGALLSLPAGLLTDRIGRRNLLLWSVVAGLISQVGIAAATGAAPMYFWQVVLGFMAGATQACLFASLADAVPARKLGQAMGWLTLSMQVGFLLGPAVAGISLNLLSTQAALYATTAVFALGFGLSLLIPKDAVRAQGSWDLAGPLRTIAAGRGFYAVIIGVFAASMLWGTFQTFLPLFGKQVLGLPGPQIGYLLAVIAVFNGLARIPGGRFVDRARRRGPIVLIGIVGFAVGVAILPHLTGFWAPAAVMAITVPFSATAFIAISVSFGGLSTAENRGVAMGVYGAFLYLGLGVGPAVFGAVLERSGYTTGFTALAITSVLLAGLMALARTEPIRRRSRVAVAMPPAAPGT